MLSSSLIGRNRELFALQQALRLTESGQGRLVLLSGEAGIGKSRLLAETRVQAQAWVTLTGNCYEQDAAYPYSLWIDALRRYLAPGKETLLSGLPESVAAQLARLSPELESLARPAPAANEGPEAEKRRLYNAVLHLIAHLSATSPVLFEIEDIHWSDEASLDLLRFVVRQVDRYPVMFLATYRSDEARPALAAFLADMDRLPQAVELRLAQLSRSEVQQMVASLLSISTPAALPDLDPAYPLMEGNPFYIEEITQSLVESGYLSGSGQEQPGEAPGRLEIPRSVQESVRRRLETTSPGARDLLTLAAVAGEQFDLRLLETLSQTGIKEFLQQVRELVDARLVSEVTPETFSFRHALTRQAVISTLLGRERQALHLKIAKGIEAQNPVSLDAFLTDLSYHFYAAGSWPSARDYSEKAGQKTQALAAPRETVIHFSRAIEAARQIGDRPSFACLEGRARAYEMLGDFDRSRDDFEAALVAARLSQVLMDEWQATLNLGFLWQSRNYNRAGQYFQAALELAHELGDPAVLGRSLNRLGNWRMSQNLNQNQTFEARELHLQALHIFEDLQNDLGVAETLELLELSHYMCGNIIQGVTCFYRALELWDRLGNQRGKLFSLLHASFPLVIETEVTPPIDPAMIREWGETCVRIAREMDWRGAEISAYVLLAQLSRVGEFSQSLEMIHHALQISQEINHQYNLTFCNSILGDIYLALLDLPAARQALEQSREIAAKTGFGPIVLRSSIILASVLIEAQQLTQADAILDVLISEWAPRQSVFMRMGWKVKADLALAQGKPELVLEIVDRLLDTAENVKEYGRKSIPALSTLRGKALARLGRWEEAEAELIAAVDVASRQNRLPLLWRILVSQGKIYLSQKKKESAAGAFDRARALVGEIATHVPASHREQFLQHALAEFPPAPWVEAHPERPVRPGGLTRREQEIAALIAQGKSNREIAGELYLGVRTVEAHITRILTRLGYSSRIEIAVWAAKEGIGFHKT
jgi:predicted ATPase/DNA-binding CsgD family transcriptional regulator